MHGDDDEHLYSHAERCLCTQMLTSISIYMQSAASAQNTDEHLYLHAERCLCTEMMKSISIHVRGAGSVHRC